MVARPRRASAPPSSSASSHAGSESRTVLLPKTATIGWRCGGVGTLETPGGGRGSWGPHHATGREGPLTRGAPGPVGTAYERRPDPVRPHGPRRHAPGEI